MGWDIILWEPTLSPHKTGLVEALSEHSAVSAVKMIAHADITPERKLQGWSTPEVDGQNICVALDDAEIESIFRDSPPDSVHLINGMRGSRTIVTALRMAAKYGVRYGIMSEPRVSEGLSGILRFTQSIVTEGRIRKTAGFVLGIGAHGPRWFSRTLYRQATIFPFAYFIKSVEKKESHLRDKIGASVAYLGRLELEKGIDLFLDAVTAMNDSVRIRIAGFGSKISLVETAVSRSEGKLIYCGVLPMSDVPEYLDQTDILVVPSRSTNDGWAAVISEALMHGVAVVASEKVGASVLLRDPDRGEVVRSEDSAAIADAVNGLIGSDRISSRARDVRRNWANRWLSAEGGAEYLLDILGYLYEDKVYPTPFFDRM